MSNDIMMSLGELRSKQEEYEVWDQTKQAWVLYKNSDYSKSSGFPNIFTANERINLISVQAGDNIYSFGLHPLTDGVVPPDDVVYVHCKDEADLLVKFLLMLGKYKPDVITGWNSNGFDIPYLYNRMCVVLTEDDAKMLSPLGMCKKVLTNNLGREGVAIEISGLQTLDYLELYRKFELSPRENYKLDTIGLIEVNEGKLEYEGSFKHFSRVENWGQFCQYNWRDVRLVKKLDTKLQFIRVAFAMALSSKCNFGDVYRVTRIWDNIIANHLRAKNIHVDADFHHVGETYEGAYVKPTIPGLYEWCASFDVASLYPSMIIQYNISPDTILPRSTFHNIGAQDVITNSDKFKVAISDALSKNATLCANGSMYSKSKQGFLPELVEHYFAKRVSAKNEMKRWAKEAERVKLELEKRG